MAPTPAIPAGEAALTSQWLGDALGFAVRGFEVQYFSEGTGVIGLVTRVLLDSADGPDSIIAKFPSPAAENRQVAATYDMYGREVQFYREIAPSLGIRTPHCYYGAHDPDTQDFILLLEDLADFRIGDQVAGCTLEEARSVVDAIARLHGSTWTGREFPELVSHNTPMQREGMVAGFRMGWPVVLEQFAELIPAQARSAGAKMPDAIGRLLDAMTLDPVCLSHADVRLDNIFFGSDDEVVLVDWQSVCTSAPEQDLAYFLTQSVPAEVRQQEDLVARYQSKLADQGIDYALDDCRARYRICALYLLSYAVVIAGTLDMGNDRGLLLARTLLSNSLQALTELDAFELLESL